MNKLSWICLIGLAAHLGAESLKISTDRFQAEAELGDLISLRTAAGAVLMTNPASPHGLILQRIDIEHQAGLESGPAILQGTNLCERLLTNFTALPGASARCRYALDAGSGDLLISQECTSPQAGLWGVQWFLKNIPLEYSIIVPGMSGIKLTRFSGLLLLC